MKSKLLDEGPEKTWALIMDSGDKASSSLALFAREKKLRGSDLTAIGGYSRATLGYYDWETKTYLKIPIDEPGAESPENLMKKFGPASQRALISL